MTLKTSGLPVVLLCLGLGVPLPLWAQDKETIVFASGRTGDGDIYQVDLGSGEVLRVLGTEAPEGTVRYDPARNRLVYHLFRGDSAMLMSDGRPLFEDPNGDVAPQWSPRGTVAYVAEDSEGTDLFVADSINARPRRLTRDADVERYPSWSPDGQTLIYAKRKDSWDLYRLDVTTGEETRVTFIEGYVGHPAWSPDGTMIAFDRMYGEQTDIAILDLATGDITRATDRPGNDLIPAWSGDGRRIAFGGASEDGNWDLWLLDLATNDIVRLTEDPAPDGGPIFVPVSALPKR